MSLHHLRILPLLLLLGLLAGAGGGGGVVAMVTAPTCQQDIPSGLMRDLWSRTKALRNKLPTEEKYSRRHRLLPKFCNKCSENVIGWLEVRELIDVYQRKVFSREVVQKLLPQHYNELLHRLQHTLHHCVASSKPSDYVKDIRRLERKFQKRTDERALKAFREFTFVLRWIDELVHHMY